LSFHGQNKPSWDIRIFIKISEIEIANSREVKGRIKRNFVKVVSPSKKPTLAAKGSFGISEVAKLVKASVALGPEVLGSEPTDENHIFNFSELQSLEFEEHEEEMTESEMKSYFDKF